MTVSELSAKLLQSASKVVQYLEKQLQEDGSYGDQATDLSCYYKSPMLFIMAGKSDIARRLLNHIQGAFMQSNGDFKTNAESKSIKPEYTYFWSYMNGWMIRAAQRLDMQKMTDAAYAYFKQYHLPDGGFLTHNITDNPAFTDILTGAHHGLVHLEMGNRELAMAAGDYLCEAIRFQPDIQKGFYLTFDKQGKPIKDYDASLALFSFLDREAPDQFYFMLGYPAAYLCILYQHTQEERFLQAAKYYIDYALTCHKNVYQSYFSHKIAWASAYLYNVTGDKKYLHAVETIVDFFFRQQTSSGLWHDDFNTSYDQSAEIACWFLDIVQNLQEVERKNRLNLVLEEKEMEL